MHVVKFHPSTLVADIDHAGHNINIVHLIPVLTRCGK